MSDISNKDSLTDFDVVSFARKILSEVESIRSFSKVTDDQTGEKFQLPSESRINAFFRLIGLPMFVIIKAKEDKKKEAESAGFNEPKRHLTPGFSRTVSPKLTNLYTIEHNGETPEGALCAAREKALLQTEQYIGTKELNTAMVEALKTPIPLQADVTSVSGSTRNILKQLKPLITFYLPDGILPRNNELARPFLTGQDDMIDSETRLTKPFIETVIRIRLVETAGGGDTTNKSKEVDITDSISDFLGFDKDGQSIFDQVFPNKYLLKHTDVREGFIISKLTSALQTLASKWVALKNKQQRLASQIDFNISINTTSAKSSLFGRRASVSTVISDDSVLGKKIKRASEKVAVEESFISLFTSDDSANPDKTTPKVKETKNMSASALAGPFNEILNHNLTQYGKSLNDLKEERKKKSRQLDKLRVDLDLMTGEFTGLSMPDVIIVMMALFLISEKELVSLLDKETRQEMEKNDTLKTALQSIGTVEASEAVGALEDVVDDLYKLLDINIRRITNRQESNSRLSRNNKRKSNPTKRGSSFESK